MVHFLKIFNNAVDVKLPTREEEDDFGSIYHKVFHSSPKAQLHLLKIEQQMNIMYRAAMNTRETEIEELRGVYVDRISY
jgi:hypothetical protein